MKESRMTGSIIRKSRYFSSISIFTAGSVSGRVVSMAMSDVTNSSAAKTIKAVKPPGSMIWMVSSLPTSSPWASMFR